MSSKSGILLAAALVAAPLGTARAGGAEPISPTTYPLAIVSVYDLAQDAFATSTALYFALNGDLAREGFLGRLSVSTDSYSYDLPGAPGGDIDGDAWGIDAMLGYRWIRGDVASSLFVGAEHQDHDLSPNDLGNPVRDSETGFKVAFDITKAPSAYSPVYAELAASYSTAFDTYQVDGRLGYSFDGFIIGPEAWLMGDESSDAQRIGGFLKTSLPPLLFSDVSTAITVSAGYQFVDDDNGRSTFGSDGAYGSVRFTTLVGESWFAPFR